VARKGVFCLPLSDSDLLTEYQRLRKQHDELRFQYSCLYEADMAGQATLRISLMRHVQEVSEFIEAVRDLMPEPQLSKPN
jgi:hypothetical protein